MTDISSITSLQKQNTGNLKPALQIPPLKTYYLYLTTGCNLACRHCWITPIFSHGKFDPGDYLSFELLKQLVNEGKPLGLDSVKLTGGEPLLHPQFVEIVDYLSASDISITMETNATLIDVSLASHLKKNSTIRSISVSLDGATEKSHDAFRNVQGAFKAALNGISHLVAEGFNVQIIMSVYKGNLDEISDVVKLAEKSGATSIKFNPVVNSGRAVTLFERGEALSEYEIVTRLKGTLAALRNQHSIKLLLMIPPAMLSLNELIYNGYGGGTCGVSTILGILGSGEIALCGIGRNIPELCFGIAGIDHIQKVWSEHPTLLRLRHELAGPYPGLCGDCIHASLCQTGCVANNFHESGKLVEPSRMCTMMDQLGLFPETRRCSYTGKENDISERR